MKVLVSVCLFLTLLSPVLDAAGIELSICRHCEGLCNQGVFDGCPPRIRNKACYSKITDFPVEGEPRHQTLYRRLGCIEYEDCHPVNYTASLPNGGYMHLEVQCCNNKQACNWLISVPKQKDRALNEMNCPGCFQKGKEPCTSDTTVSCREHENKCISYTGRLKTPGLFYKPLSFKGCATKNLCDLLTGATEDGKDLMKPLDKVEAACSPAEYPVNTSFALNGR